MLRHFLAGTQAGDPALSAMAIALVATTAAIACRMPARRTTRIRPVTALK